MRTKLIFTLLLSYTTHLFILLRAEEKGLYFGASYTGDVVSNFSGGIKRGTNYLGFATLQAGFDTQKAGWWKGGESFVKLANTHGDEPSATLIGNFQGVSNIEAGNITWLYEFWADSVSGNSQ